jgi:hypothetical protein
MVVVAARRQKERVRHANDHVEAEDADVEVVHALDVRRLQVDVADVDAGGDWPRRALDRGEACVAHFIDHASILTDG